MFIFKYALKSISRSIGRNILIGIIVFMIATAACVAMSIQQAAETAASNSLKDMNIAAQVNIDRGYIYKKAQEENNTTDMKELMPAMTSMMKEYALDLEDMEEYAGIKKADSDEPLVKSYYYNASISIDGESIEKYDLTASSSTEETTAEAQATAPTMVDPEGNIVETPTPSAPEMAQPEQMEKQGDFSLVGYSSYEAMEDFGDAEDDSICTITDGEIFEDNTDEYVCIIENDLADYNNVGVGDEISLVNPNNDSEAYTLKIVGIYDNSSGTSSNGDDAANTIITSYAVVKDIEAQSEAANPTSDSDEESDAMLSQFVGTFVFGSVDDYNQFKEEVKDKAVSEGFDEDMYIVTSSDIAAFKAGLKPLENLKSFATTFLYLMLGIGAIVLIVISVISIRDRKYEIGVLAAMGLKKFKLSMMFMIEVLIVTLIAIMAGAAVGSSVSVPVTNYLLSAQVEQTEQDAANKQQSQQMMPGGDQERPEDGDYDQSKVSYIHSVGFSVDIFVILKMLAIGIGLSVVSGFTSILFILRYDPKQILANRD